MGFKSPACCPAITFLFIRNKIAEALDEINCDSVRNGGEVPERSGDQRSSHGDNTVSRRTEIAYKAEGEDEVAQHAEVQGCTPR